jgi:hypothetical protein
VWVNEPQADVLETEQTGAFAPEPLDAEGVAGPEPESAVRYSAPSLWRPTEEEEAETAPPPADAGHAGASLDAHAPERRPRPARPRGIAPPVGQPEPRADFDPRCGFCDSALPGGRIVRFCPHCGADQALRPCASCGEPLDASWGFCTACGATQGG